MGFWIRSTGVGAKFLIDVLTLISFALVTSTGFLLYFVLPHGSGSLNGRGSLRRGVHLLWGMDRRQWGDLHLILCIVLLVCLLAHLVQHWKWVKGYYLNKMSTPLRISLLLILLLTSILSAAPFIAVTTVHKPAAAEINRGGRGRGQYRRSSRHDDGPAQPSARTNDAETSENEQSDLRIRGRDTIAEAAKHMKLSPARVKELLELPADTDDATRMSVVKDRLKLTMSDLRKRLSQ